MKTLTSSALVLLLLVSPALSQVPDDKLIVPGQRIARWTLAMTIADLTQMNGPPNRVAVSAAQDLVREIRLHFWDRLGFFAVTNATDTQRVEILVATSDEFKTEKGIAVNSRREAVETAYGRPTAEMRHTVGDTTFAYDEIGLGMIFGQPGLATQVLVFRPGTGRQIWKF